MNNAGIIEDLESRVCKASPWCNSWCFLYKLDPYKQYENVSDCTLVAKWGEQVSINGEAEVGEQ